MRGMEVLVVRATGVEEFLVLLLRLQTVGATGVEQVLLLPLPTVGGCGFRCGQQLKT